MLGNTFGRVFQVTTCGESYGWHATAETSGYGGALFCIVNGVPPGILTDLDGRPRFVDDPDTPDTGNGTPPIVDMGAYEFQVVSPCPADINGDNTVDVLDLLLVLAAWGATSGPEDINGDGIVDVLDLLEVLAAWGPC